MSASYADIAIAIGESFAVALLLKATLTLAVVLVAARLARRSRAAVRHMLMAAAFAVLLVLPAASSVIPSRDVQVLTSVAAMPEPPAAIVPMFASEPPQRSDPSELLSVPGFGSTRVPVSALLWTIWAVGALLSMLPVLAGTWQMRSVRRSGVPWPRGRALARGLASDGGVHRFIDVRLHESIPGPMTYGLLRPVFLLPLDAESWNEDELRRAIIHELEHVRRADWMSQFVARTVCAVYWFHPLVWLAWHRLGLEAERACDDAVLRRAEATAYANQLVLLAERLSSTAAPPLLAMAACRDLTTRVRAVLDGAQARGRAGTLPVGAAIVAVTVFVTAVAPLRAVRQGQSPTDGAKEPVLAFETASVKPNKSGAEERYIQRDPSGVSLTVVNLPLRQLITFAYQIQPFQLEGGPDWIAVDRFDILARPERAVPATAPLTQGQPDPLRLMLRTLLADRFRLAVHKETKESPIFELVLARQDGKPGPQLRPASVDCVARLAATQAAARGGGPPPATLGSPGPGSCGISMNPGRIRFGGSPLTAFANTLAPLTQRVVVDRTGLTGNWDFELTFTPDPSQLPPGAPPGVQLPNVDPNGASLFTAIEEQLGLKLRPARGPVEVLVIDRVEQPTEN